MNAQEYLNNLVKNGETKIEKNLDVFDSATTIAIPNGIEEIGDEAFADCTDLKSITIPNTVKNIGESAFAATGIASIIIPVGVKEIEDKAFLDCVDLKSIAIPDTVKHLGDDLFFGCDSLKTLYCSTRIMDELYDRDMLNLYGKFDKTMHEFREREYERKDYNQAKTNESVSSFKRFTVKNYKGNIVESLSRFQKNHKDMKIVEATEFNGRLNVKARTASI